MVDQDALRAVLTEQRANLRDEIEGQGADPESDEVTFVDDAGFSDRSHSTEERSKLISVVRALRSNLRDVDRALAKMDAGTYGTCERCGKPIAPERLEVAHAADGRDPPVLAEDEGVLDDVHGPHRLSSAQRRVRRGTRRRHASSRSSTRWCQGTENLLREPGQIPDRARGDPRVGFTRCDATNEDRLQPHARCCLDLGLLVVDEDGSGTRNAELANGEEEQMRLDGPGVARCENDVNEAVEPECGDNACRLRGRVRNDRKPRARAPQPAESGNDVGVQAHATSPVGLLRCSELGQQVVGDL